MTAGDELEEALQRGWSFDELEVYADHLLACSDPRGDIVALDLSPRPEQPSWVARRRAALAAWLGHDLATRVGHLVQHGFVHALRDGMAPPELLASPAGTFVRDYTTFGRLRVADSLQQLAARPRPWLSRLTIAYRPAWQGDAAPRLPASLVTALIAATPRLEELTLCGDPPFDAFPHPNLRRARLDTRCYGIETAAAKTRIEVSEQAPEPRIADDDLNLLMALVELAPDCNQLYTHGAELAEPLPALLARLAAAQLVELDGPVVRVAGLGMALRPGPRRVDVPELAAVRGWISLARTAQQITNLRAHAAFLAACLGHYPAAARTQDTVLDYLGVWERLGTGDVVVDRERLERIRAAFAALLELRGLWPSTIGTAADWELVEVFARELEAESHVYFRRQQPFPYWY